MQDELSRPRVIARAENIARDLNRLREEAQGLLADVAALRLAEPADVLKDALDVHSFIGYAVADAHAVATRVRKTIDDERKGSTVG